MRYFFILGTNPGISAVEVMSIIDGSLFTVTEVYKQAIIIDGKDDLDLMKLMDRLGGTIKIGRIFGEEREIDDQNIIDDTLKIAHEKRGDVGRVTFGFSAYSLESEKPASKAAALSGKFKKIGMEVKRHLKEEGVSCRFVRPQTGSALSSVAAQKNGLNGPGGFEYVVLAKGSTMLTGITGAIQPFERFSQADYGRPSRDTFQGMLPPKLARIMLNIGAVKPGHTVLDPFCGSGTVLTEALQLGVRNIIGSDNNPDAIDSTKTNISWLVEKRFAPEPDHLDVFVADARNVASKLSPSSIDVIVTEPFLGPPRRGGESRGDLQKRLFELTKLYLAALENWKPLLKPNAPIVIALPLYIIGMEKHGIDANEFHKIGLEAESLFPQRFLERMGIRETKNKGLVYGRNDQHVWRDIIRLRVK